MELVIGFGLGALSYYGMIKFKEYWNGLTQ